MRRGRAPVLAAAAGTTLAAVAALAALAIALLVVLALLLRPASHARATIDGGAAEATRSAAPERAEPSLAPLRRADDAGERIAVAVAPAPTEPDVSSQPPVEIQLVGAPGFNGAPDFDGAIVRVVTGMDGVGWFGLSVAELRERARRGTAYRANASGRVSIPRPVGGPLLPYAVAAEHGELWGWMSARVEDDSVEVTLVNCEPFVVTVEHADGTPAAGVLLRAGAERSSLEPVALTDSRGRARLPDREAYRFVGVEVVGSPDVVLPTFIERATEGSAPAPIEQEERDEGRAAGPVTLRLPPCGSLEVRLVDEHGGSLPVRSGVVRVRLAIRNAAPDSEPDSAAPGLGEQIYGHATWSLPIAQDRVRWPLVALGQRFALSFDGDGLSAPFGLVEWNSRGEPTRVDERHVVGGPVRAGERTVARFSPLTSLAFLSLQLLDEQMAPLVRQPFLVREVPRGQSLATATPRLLTSDDDGRIRLQPGGSRFDPGEAWAEVRRIDLVWALGGTRGVSLRALPTPRPGGADRGSLQLVDVPVLVAGLVRDSGGRPVADAHVRCVDAGDSPLDPRAPPRRNRVRERSEVATLSDAVGRFELRGWFEPDTRVAVTARHGTEEAMFEPVVPAGSREAELVLAAPGELSVDVLLDDFVSPGSLRVRLQPEGDPAASGARSLSSRRVVSGERQRFAKVTPGRYAVVVTLESVPAGLAVGATSGLVETPFARVGGVVVGSGAETLDPRLHPLDLRGRIAELAVFAADGRVHAETLVCSFRRSGAYAAWSPPSAHFGGRVTLAVADGAIDVRIDSATHRSEVVERVEAGHAPREVTLRRAAPVRVLVLGAEGLPERTSLRVCLTSVDSAALGASWTVTDSGTDGGPRELRPGAYAVSMWLLTPRSDYSGAFFNATVTPATASLFVADRTDEQSFVLAPDPASLRSALEAGGRGRAR